MTQLTPVSRCLDKKLTVCGFEVPDLIGIFILLSILNFVFGDHGSKLLLVWLPPAALAVVLRVTKRNRPDHFLKHWLRFQFQPGVWHAFPFSAENRSIHLEGEKL